MKADQDIGIKGAQVHAGNNVTLDAGRDLTVESATGAMRQDTDSMSVAAGGGLKANVGANGVGVGANAYASVSGSKSDYESINHRNAVVKAEKELSTTSGRDTTVAGAHLQGETVTMKVGEDLTVASRQDNSDGSSSSYGVSADVMIGAGASGSLSANVGKGKNSSGWVHDQTIIIGEEKVDIRVEDNTHVEGAVVAAKNGNLKLDTNTLTYADIHDHDKASNINVGVSVSGSYNGGTDGPKQVEDEGALDASLGSVSLDYSSKDRRQINRATIGEGTVIIRSDPDAGLEGLNRDLARAQEITKDSETAVSVYIDPAVLSQVIDLLGRALTSGDNGQERLAEMTGKMLVEQGLLPKEVWNAIVNWERMSSEEKGVAKQHVGALQSLAPEEQAKYVDSLSVDEWVGIATYALILCGKSSSDQAKGDCSRLATMAMVGGEVYARFSDINSQFDYVMASNADETFLPPSVVKDLGVKASGVASLLSLDGNRSMLVDGLTRLHTASGIDDKAVYLEQVSKVIGKAFGVDGIKIQVVSEMKGVSAYVNRDLHYEDGAFGKSLSCSSDRIIYVPLNSKLFKSNAEFSVVVTTLSHEITHIVQSDMINDYLDGRRSDIGGLLLMDVDSKSYNNSRNVGLYRVRPTEAHARAFAEDLVGRLQKIGVVK